MADGANAAGHDSSVGGEIDGGRYKCTVAILNSEVRSAGSYFGSGVAGDFQLETSFVGVGPLLLFRPVGYPVEKSSILYAPTRVNSTCDELEVDFVQVTSEVGTVAGLVEVKPSSRLKIKAKLFFGRPEEGEFRQVDLRVGIYFDDDRPSDQISMLRASRYKLPADAKDKVMAKKLNQMSQEVCGLITGSVSEKDKYKLCIESVSGGKAN